MQLTMQLKLIVLGSLLGISSLLLACTSDQAARSNPSVAKEPAIVNAHDPNEAVSSDDAVVPPIVSTSSKAMMIDGTIEQVMESWPLQLTVITRSGRYYVALQSDTTVTQQGKTVAQETLKPGIQVQISGQQSATDDMALTAQTIQVQ